MNWTPQKLVTKLLPHVGTHFTCNKKSFRQDLWFSQRMHLLQRIKGQQDLHVPVFYFLSLKKRRGHETDKYISSTVSGEPFPYGRMNSTSHGCGKTSPWISRCKKYGLKLGQIQKRVIWDNQEKEKQPNVGKTTTSFGWLSLPNQAEEGVRLLSVTLFGVVHLKQKRTAENKKLAECWHKHTYVPQAHLGWKAECFQLWKLKFWNILPAWADW